MIGSPEYWGAMTNGGAIVEKHDNTQESPFRIIRMHLSKQARELQLQTELVQNGNVLANTPVGVQVTTDITDMFFEGQKRIKELEKKSRSTDAENVTLKAALDDEMKQRKAEAERQKEEIEKLKKRNWVSIFRTCSYLLTLCNRSVRLCNRRLIDYRLGQE